MKSLSNLIDFLEAFGKLREMQKNAKNPINIAKTDTEVILEIGRPMLKRHLLDERLVNAESKQCYDNAWTMKNRRRKQRLRYCEGYVALENIMIPVHHGWLLNDEDEVVDPSVYQNKTAVYYGIEYADEFAKKAWALLRKKRLIGIMLNMYALDEISQNDFYNGVVYRGVLNEKNHSNNTISV